MILVAGGTGRLGTLVVRRLVARGERVRVLTRDPQRASHLGTAVELVEGDVRDRSSLARAASGVGSVVSAVHGFVGPRGISPASVDRDGNAKLTDAAKAAGADLVLVSIVGAAADSPMELFRMKHAAECYARASGVPTTIVRATAFMELWIEIFRQTAARSGRPLVFGRGQNPINFVSVGDVAALVDAVVGERSARGSTLEIGGPENVTLVELAARVQAADGRAQPPRHVPPWLLWSMAQTLGRLVPVLGRQARAALGNDRVDLAFDPTPLRRLYPALPHTSLAEVLHAGAAAAESTAHRPSEVVSEPPR